MKEHIRILRDRIIQAVKSNENREKIRKSKTYNMGMEIIMKCLIWA